MSLETARLPAISSMFAVWKENRGTRPSSATLTTSDTCVSLCLSLFFFHGNSTVRARGMFEYGVYTIRMETSWNSRVDSSYPLVVLGSLIFNFWFARGSRAYTSSSRGPFSFSIQADTRRDCREPAMSRRALSTFPSRSSAIFHRFSYRRIYRTGLFFFFFFGKLCGQRFRFFSETWRSVGEH